MHHLAQYIIATTHVRSILNDKDTEKGIKMLKAVLFDLDGTLLPMDQDAFTNLYFNLMAETMEPHGYDRESLIKTIWKGTGAMVQNDGLQTNEEVFWKYFAAQYPNRDITADKPLFNAFYTTVFQKAIHACSPCEESNDLVKTLKKHNIRIILATNPLFPSAATLARISWAGLDRNDFEYVSTYENSRFCKPNPCYYGEILKKLSLKVEECIMVGNDAEEDTAASMLGMGCFLLTDCLINKRNLDIQRFPHGGFDTLNAYLMDLISEA